MWLCLQRSCYQILIGRIELEIGAFLCCAAVLGDLFMTDESEEEGLDCEFAQASFRARTSIVR